jgi:DNA-binding response OmpR family regulator
MDLPGRILMADDEETFLESTADLLRREGYQCATARDASSAAGLLRADEYDLLVVDIRMPGNVELGLLRHAAALQQELPVIVVTGYPSIETAISAIDLSVAAYLVKPIDFDQFLVRVRATVSGRRATRALRDMRQRLVAWREDMLRATDQPAAETWTAPRPRGPATAFEVFLAGTSRTIMDCLGDMRHLAEALAGSADAAEPCHLLHCPRLRQFRETVVEAIQVLEQTKNAFKSRQLGDIRRKLEDLVREMPERSA